MAYIGKKNFESANTESILEFIATAGQTTFTVGYSIGHCEVFLNGIKLAQGDFTANNGTSVVLTTGASLNDVIQIKSQSVKGLVDAYSTVQVDGLLNNKAPIANPIFTGTVGLPASTALASPALTGTVSIDGKNISPYGKNYIINGGFDYWNYATSQTTANTYGSDDRWSNNFNGASTRIHSRVASTDTERVLFNSTYFSRTVVTSVIGVGNNVSKVQKIENVTKLSGKTITISFWAKADATKNILVTLTQNFGTGGAPSASVSGIGSQLISLPSTWQKKTITIAIPAIVGKTLGTDGVHTSSTILTMALEDGSNSLGNQSGTFDIAEVKLEEGSVATPWTPYEGEFGGEVQACQRYLPAWVGASEYINGMAGSTTSATFTFPFKVATRVPPSGIVVSASSDYSHTNIAAINTASSGITIGSAGLNGSSLNSAGTGFTVYQPMLLRGNNANAKILFTGCEL